MADIEWTKPEGAARAQFAEVPGSEREIPAQRVFLAMGYVHPPFAGLLEQLGIELNERQHVADQKYQTNVDHVFVAGDMRRGQSLVVWAISEGREAAFALDQWLMGESKLERKDASLMNIQA